MYMASFTFLLVHCGSLVSTLVLSSETECPVALQWSPTPVGMVRLEIVILVGLPPSSFTWIHRSRNGSFVVKFRLCGELNVAVYAVNVCSETIHIILMYLHKRIVHISEPHRGGTWCR